MSAFSGCRSLARARAGSVGGWAPIVWVLIAQAMLAGGMLMVAFLGLAPAARAAESGKAKAPQIQRISVSGGGIVVERPDGTDSLDLAEEPVPRRIRSYRRGWIQVDDRGDQIVRVFADAHVPAGKQVPGDVVAVFGSVDVEGHVQGDVVAVMGSVRLRPGAVVEGDAVSIGGALDQAEGSEVSGETVSVSLVPASWGFPALSFSLGAIVAGWLAAVFVGWLFVLLFPARLVRVAAVASRRTAASLLLGLVSVPLFVAAVFLLFVTVVGIPLAVLLPPAYLVLCFAGQLAATYVLGCKLTSRRPGSGGLMVPLLAGTLLVALFYLTGALMFVLPGIARPVALFALLLGCLMVAGLTAIGTGAFMLSKLGSEPRDVDWSPAAAMAPPPGADLAPPPPVASA